MKKRTLLSMALLATAITVFGTPLTAHAAGLTKVASNGCYQIYVGTFCPDINIPGTSAPDNGPADETALSYAEQVAALVNEERAKAGLPALEVNAEITEAANVRAKEIKQSFSHTRPDGSSFSSALKEQGVSYRGSGENIAWGQKSPEQVMNGWMNSEGHRANILNKNFKNIGVGYYQDANGVNYWVQLFTY